MEAGVQLHRACEERIGDRRWSRLVADRHHGLHRCAACDREDAGQGERDEQQKSENDADTLDAQKFSHLPVPLHILHAKRPSPVVTCRIVMRVCRPTRRSTWSSRVAMWCSPEWDTK